MPITLLTLWKWFRYRPVNHLLVLACLSLALSQITASFSLHTGLRRCNELQRLNWYHGNADVQVFGGDDEHPFTLEDAAAIRKDIPDATMTPIRYAPVTHEALPGRVAFVWTCPAEAFAMDLFHLSRGKGPGVFPPGQQWLWLEEELAARLDCGLNDTVTFRRDGVPCVFRVAGLLRAVGMISPDGPRGVCSLRALPDDDQELNAVYLSFTSRARAIEAVAHLEEVLRPKVSTVLVDWRDEPDIFLRDALLQAVVASLAAASIIASICLMRSLTREDVTIDRETVATLHGLGWGSAWIRAVFVVRMILFLGIALVISLAAGLLVGRWILGHLRFNASSIMSFGDYWPARAQVGLCVLTLAALALTGMNSYLAPVVGGPGRSRPGKGMAIVSYVLGAGLIAFVFHRLARTSTLFDHADLYVAFFVAPLVLLVAYVVGGRLPRLLICFWPSTSRSRRAALQRVFLKAIDSPTLGTQSFLNAGIIGAGLLPILILLAAHTLVEKIRGDLVLTTVETSRRDGVAEILAAEPGYHEIGEMKVAWVESPSHGTKVRACAAPEALARLLLNIAGAPARPTRASTTARHPLCHVSYSLGLHLGIEAGDLLSLAGDQGEKTFVVADLFPMPADEALMIPLAELERLATPSRSVVIGSYQSDTPDAFEALRERVLTEANDRNFASMWIWSTSSLDRIAESSFQRMVQVFPAVVVAYVVLGGLAVVAVGVRNIRNAVHLHAVLRDWGMTPRQFLLAAWPSMLLLVVTVGALAWILPLAAYRFNAQRMAQRFMLTELPPIPGTILGGMFAASVGVAALSMVLPRLVLAFRPLRLRALQPRAGAATVEYSA